MANINDPEIANRPENNPPVNPLLGNNLFNRIFSFGHQNENPRDQGFFSTYRTIFCPSLKTLSFTFVIIIVNIFFYIVTLLHSIANGGLETKDDSFLAPSESTLLLFGAKVS